MEEILYDIKITLEGTTPMVWRKIRVWADLSLEDFHKVIQLAMGWHNAHLHQFIKGESFYQPKDPEAGEFPPEPGVIDYETVRIMDLLKAEGDQVTYEYDFGDAWLHEVTLEKVIKTTEELEYPLCLDGAMACPPESCGGIFGYQQLVEVMKDPSHEEFDSYIIWLGRKFNPAEFDKEVVNVFLKYGE